MSTIDNIALANKTSMVKKFIVLIAMVSVVITAAVTSLLAYREYKTNLLLVNDQLNKIEISSIASLAEALWNENQEQANAQLTGIAALKDIVHVAVKLTDKETFAYELGTATTSNSITKKMPIIMDNSGEKQNLGDLMVTVSLSGAQEAIKKQVFILAGTQLSQALIVSLIIYFIFKVLVSFHLFTMANYCEKLDMKDLTNSAPLALTRKQAKKQDELDQVVFAFNNMRGKIIEFNAALQDYSRNLEKKVEERTVEIATEKRKVSNLLNSMRQAVFAIDRDYKIVGPVSGYAYSVFGTHIEGANVFDRVYGSLDPSTEASSMLRSSLTAIFGEDEMQWYLSEDYLIKRVTYIFPEVDDPKMKKRSEDRERIFAISYNPMFDEKGKLDRLMYVVEDVTEIERLTARMEAEKKASEKNIQIIREIAGNDLEEVSKYLNKAPQMVADALELTSTITTDKTTLSKIFHILHTLKGNSRAYSFLAISSATHNAENTVGTLTKLQKENLPISNDHLREIRYKLFDIHGELSSYNALARRIFRISNEFENRLVTDAFSIMSELDGRLSPFVTRAAESAVIDGNEDEQHKQHQVFTQLPPLEGALLQDLGRKVHSLKGLFRSLSRTDLSEASHSLEGALHAMGDLRSVTFEVYTGSLVRNIIDLKLALKTIFQESSLYSAYAGHSEEDLGKVIAKFGTIVSFYNAKLTGKSILQDDLTIAMKHANELRDLCTAMNLSFLGQMSAVMKTVFDHPMQKFLDNRALIDQALAHATHYLALLSRVRLNEKESLREKITNLVNGLPPAVDKAIEAIEQARPETCFLLSALHTMILNGISPQTFFGQIKQLLGPGWSNSAIDAFVFRGKGSERIEFYLKEMLRLPNMTMLPDGIIKDREAGDPIAHAICEHLAPEGSRAPFFTFLKQSEMGRVLMTESEGTVAAKGATEASIQILTTNFNRLADAVTTLKQSEDRNAKRVVMAFKRILDVPVKSSLVKFSGMIKDLSDRLQKKVEFEVSGDEVSMQRDSYALFQDGIIHILRNAIDHGLESPEDRTQVGKEEMGHLRIECSETDSAIVVNVRDDGKGIDPVYIKRKAVEKNILNPKEAEKMSDEEAVNLIFLPNFSSKDQVSELSGRGIGMDIVKANIGKLGGEVHIETKVGKGTQFKIKLPLAS